jgi:hypothetical protein
MDVYWLRQENLSAPADSPTTSGICERSCDEHELMIQNCTTLFKGLHMLDVRTELKITK